MRTPARRRHRRRYGMVCCTSGPATICGGGHSGDWWLADLYGSATTANAWQPAHSIRAEHGPDPNPLVRMLGLLDSPHVVVIHPESGKRIAELFPERHFFQRAPARYVPRAAWWEGKAKLVLQKLGRLNAVEHHFADLLNSQEIRVGQSEKDALEQLWDLEHVLGPARNSLRVEFVEEYRSRHGTDEVV